MTNFREAASERYIKEPPPEPMFPFKDEEARMDWLDSLPDAWHLDGVSWINALMPSKLHSCWTQTMGYVGGGLTLVRRCPCGAISIDGGPWGDRNSSGPVKSMSARKRRWFRR